MSNRSLIVARMAPESAPAVADLFHASDSDTALPDALGVRRRSLYRYHDLYFHLVEFAGAADEALRGAGDLPEFRRLSEALRPHIAPYDPRTWRSPADAMAQEFYHYESARQR
jgi:cyclase